ncbi:MAG: lytic transglycosylase domain-containing protein [Tissierellia bacterium]|nr:lytic transglycosylase domain-containing protein [Tissierellia bacterium]
MFRIRKTIKRIFTTLIILLILLAGGLSYLAINYPIGYESIIVKYSNEFNVDPYLVASIINVESKYDTYAISNKEAKGLMQISPQTGKWGSEVLMMDNYSDHDLFDPEINIRIGTWYLSVLLKEFNNNLDLVLAAYNAGSGNVSKWLNNGEYSTDGHNLTSIPYKETEDYLARVKDSYRIYSTVYKQYMINSTNENYFYIKLINNVRKLIKTVFSIR